MNLLHKEAIAGNLVTSIAKLLDAEVKHQVVTDSSGKTKKRIVIDYD